MGLRHVVADFGGGTITSDAGALLLGATGRAIGLVDRFAACFSDLRRQDLIEHGVQTLVGQRVFGLARNARLTAHIADELAAAEAEANFSGKAARRFKDFMWTTLDSWSRRRRVVAKAEWTNGEANPRLVVTSLKKTEQEGRTSTATLRANQLRLWFASMAYVLLCALRRIGLAHTRLPHAA